MEQIPKGTYIVAVSGGVDSMVLLDQLRRQAGLKLVVAHVDHGIRPDSSKDRMLVASFCMSHNISFTYKELYLGVKTSEALARSARYNFLQQCRIAYKARAIITAHHQDDVIDTVLINLMRGTGWRGLAPLMSTPRLLRPLLHVPKSALVVYARHHNLPWREDATNNDQRYLRNYIRLTIRPLLTQLNPRWEENILRLIRKQHILRRKIDAELEHQLTLLGSPRANATTESRRYQWIMLPKREALELLQATSRQVTGHTLVARRAEAALMFVKTAKAGKRMFLDELWQLRVTSKAMIVEPRPSVIS